MIACLIDDPDNNHLGEAQFEPYSVFTSKEMDLKIYIDLVLRFILILGIH